MFNLSTSLSVDLKSQPLLQIFHSLNQPQISPEPSMPPEPAEAYFLLCETRGEKLFLYVGLWFEASKHRILYTSSELASEDAAEALVQAEAFAGEMGFLMDDLRFSLASESEKAGILRTVPFFYEDHETYLKALTPEEREAMDTQTLKTATRETKAEKYSHFLEQYVTLLSML